MMKLLPVCLLLICFLGILLVRELAAQPLGRSLSQLDFDEVPKPEKDPLEEILNETLESGELKKEGPENSADIENSAKTTALTPANGTNQQKNGATQKDRGLSMVGAGNSEVKRISSLQNITIRMDSNELADNSMLIPQLKGSLTDEPDRSIITSTASWNTNKAGMCADPHDGNNKCKKAAALKELLNRFSGSDDFFIGHCNNICKNKNDVGALLSLDPLKPDKMTFGLQKTDKVCKYQMKNTEESWKVLRLKSITCTCLPRSSCNVK
ncbi:MAG: hypothetical protein IT291_05865 [Deltaproteobacteria bacterium]|nr:hypothetical protein [Deltaproteobacteria bacterium]